MENINFEAYKVFCCVAKYKNITKASHELFVSQPAITQTIKKLESQTGYKLFYRTKQGVELTDNGQILYDYIKLPVECLNKGRERIIEVNIASTKTIRIGSGTTLIKTILINPLKAYTSSNPDIKVEIKYDTNIELLKMLSNDLLDMVLMNLPCEVNDNIVIMPIEEVEDIFAARSDIFSIYKNKSFNMVELNELPLALQTNLSTIRKFLNNLFGKNHIELKPIYELPSYGLVLDFVKEGLGIGFVNKKHIEGDLESGELFEIKTKFTIPSREIGVAINKKSISNKVVNDFVDLLKK